MNNSIIQVDGKFYKKCKVVMLPTETLTNRCILKWEGEGGYKRGSMLPYNEDTHKPAHLWKSYHLYILSDEEIKEGDWCMCDDRNHISESPIYFVGQCKSITSGWINVIDGQGENPDWTKKIIATTDTSLKIKGELNRFNINDAYLPRPSDAFLKAYCGLGGIDEVLVEYEFAKDYGPNGWYQEYRLKVAPDNTITIKPVNDTSKIDHLQWIYDRMVNVQNEYPESDYMIKFKDIINSLKNK